MGKLILVTGGARSGKSSFAEEMVKKSGDNILYIATCIPFDDEMKFRVKKHKRQRSPRWETIEAYKDLDVHISTAIPGKTAGLLDCITIMVSNIMLEKGMDWDAINTDVINEVEETVRVEIEKLINTVKQSPVPFIIVTNEVGMGVVPPYKLGRAMRDIAGRANQMLAKAAEEVYLCISGIPVRIK